MQVACPSCSAEYPVNERRLPATGLKMRCPKCGSRFHVHPDGRTDAEGAAPAAAAAGAKSFPKPAVPKPSGGAADDLDLDLPAPKAAKAPPPAAPRVPPQIESSTVTAREMPSAKAAAPKPTAPTPAAPKPAVPKKPLAPPVDDLELDLPAPRAQIPKPAASAKPQADDLELDLPAPKAAAAPAPALDDDFELDLPAPKSKPQAASQAKRPLAPPAGDLELDLPAPKAAGKPPRPLAPRAAPAPSSDLELDLPAPKARAKAPLAPPVPSPPAPVADEDFELDLPAPRSAGIDLPAAKAAKPALADAGRTPFDDLDLPAPKSVAQQADEAFGDLDLPMPKSAAASGFGELDLPAPKGSVDLPAAKGFGELDLPAPVGGADLPAPKSDGFGDLDLPTPRGVSDLPQAKGDGFGDLDLPMPRGASDLPVAKMHGDLDLPTPRGISDLPAVRDEADLPATYGSQDLPVAKGVADFGELELPEPRSLPPAPKDELRDAAGRAGVGGTGFGELDLGGAGGSADDMEFADIPQREATTSDPGAHAESLPPPRVAAQKKPADNAKAPPKKGRAAWIVGVLLLVLLGAGAALGLTPYGLFGIYFFDQFMPGAGDPAQVRAAIASAEEQALTDRWVDLRTSLITLGQARRGAGLNRELLGRSLVHESLYQVRFGADPSSATRASAIKNRLEERGAEGSEVALAFAADALRGGDLVRAGTLLSQARAHAANDPYVHLVAGELALARGELPEAEQAFAQAAERGAGARGLWGVARARLRGDDAEAARAAVDAVLEASPRHGEALEARAQALFDAGDAAGALALAEQVVGRAPMDGERLRVAPRVRARAWAIVGRVHEQRGRATAALDAYDRALASDDAHVPALLGAGRVLLGDRPGDALARFDSVLQAESAAELVLSNGRTAAQEAQLGSARANLALEREQEATSALEQLAAARAEDAEVLLWLGHAERRLDPPATEAAEQHYRAAIAAAPDRFPAYLALAELFFEADRGTDAGQVLQLADRNVIESAEMRHSLGAFELRRNRLPEAIRELSRALELDPELPGAHFSLGVAYRRSGRLEDAAAAFERLSQIDAGHPRLALERGLLFEARGESARAVESYEAALRESPEDMDLMLRLGAAQVAAGQIDDAEATLERVRQARPNSPEAAHFVGRVAFARGRFAEALTHFRQATSLDPTRGEFHLYVGWAALENNQLGEALQSADRTIERDPSLGEAYWVRAVVRLRSGRPADAVPDLQRALDLRPQFHRAHATLGDAYDQLLRLDDAIAQYEIAVAAIDDEGEWWWRLGRLRMDRGDRRGAAQALSRATLLGEADAPLPGWLAAAHRLYGDALRLDGQRNEAITHYQRYLTLAPPGDIDRPDVRRILMDMGAVPEAN